jgi:hypothetical protein
VEEIVGLARVALITAGTEDDLTTGRVVCNDGSMAVGGRGVSVVGEVRGVSLRALVTGEDGLVGDLFSFAIFDHIAATEVTTPPLPPRADRTSYLFFSCVVVSGNFARRGAGRGRIESSGGLSNCSPAVAFSTAGLLLGVAAWASTGVRL